MKWRAQRLHHCTNHELKNRSHVDMAKRFFSSRPSFLLLILLLAGPAFSQPAPPASNEVLPDAPTAHPSETGPVAESRSFGVVDRGEQVSPLDTHEKLMFWVHEELQPLSLFPAFVTAGWEQMLDTDPKYGSDSAAFGQRLGASIAREASMRLFSDSLLPAITHEDPRYFRMGRGSVTSRGMHAIERVIINQRDDGSQGFNYSDTLGRAAASALAMAYYPPKSQTAGVAARTWGVSLAGLAGNNLFFEFWPDVRDRIFHRHTNGSD
jgi:hypothetical protein